MANQGSKLWTLGKLNEVRGLLKSLEELRQQIDATSPTTDVAFARAMVDILNARSVAETRIDDEICKIENQIDRMFSGQ